jgi:putative transposase
MAKEALQSKCVPVALACRAFGISETCYRYEAKLSDENAEIADWLVRLAGSDKTRRWGFGLCYLFLRNVKGFVWNHKRIRRIYCELELNQRIKPKKRLSRETPEPLAVPECPNEMWSMDFMADQLGDGRSLKTLNVLWSSIRQRETANLGAEARHWAVLYPARQATAERLCRTLQSDDPPGMARPVHLEHNR